MVVKIFQIFIRLIMFILQLIFSLITSFLPSFPLSGMGQVMTSFFGLMENAFNMTYFLLGSGYVLYIDLIIIIWTTKHTILPMVIFMRKLLAKS